MLVIMYSGTVSGVEGVPVEIEVLICPGPASFNAVGLSANEGNRLEERVSEVISNSGYHFPQAQITVRPAFAGFPDGGSACDLAVATGILLVSGQINTPDELDGAVILGELSHDGSVCQTNGILPMLEMAREQHCRSVFIPAVNAVEAMLLEGITIYPVERLEQLVAHLNKERPIEPCMQASFPGNVNEGICQHDMAEIRGQEHVKRALEVAASGGHHILLSGAAGSGRRLLASTFPSILPPLTGEEILEIASIYSVNGMLPQDLSLISRRPFRVPHAHASSVELTGGGSPARPGEVSLAHQGVLFLDDLSLFGSHALEPLYLSLGEKRVRLQWQQQVIFYPARTLLIATLKPCPCGFRNDLIQECICTTSALELYQKRISGLLPGCFDIFVEVPSIAYEKLASKRQAETSAVIRDRVQAARERQRERFKGSKLTCNAEMGPDEVREFCQTDPSGEKLLSAATRQLHLSARGYHRVLRLARTIADLAGSEMIMANHLAEAIQYRPGMGL